MDWGFSVGPAAFAKTSLTMFRAEAKAGSGEIGAEKTTTTRCCMADVGGIIATAHAKRLECLSCGLTCEPTITARQTIGGDHYEKLRCTHGDGTFRRIWIGGYR